MPTEYHGKLQLASKGLFYEGPLAENDGFVNIQPWGTPEERLLASPSLTFTDVIDRLIKKCSDCPIDPGELLLVDRWHMFIYMRCVSYGGDYSFTYKCSECSSKGVHHMNLETDLEVVHPDDPSLLKELRLPPETKLVEPFELTLPLSGTKVRWRMLRGKDEHAITRYVTRVKNRRTGNGVSPASSSEISHSYRQALRIVGIDSNDNVNITDAIDFIESLKGKDLLEWRNQTSSMNIGIADTIFHKCSSCGWENESSFEIDKSFFRPRKQSQDTDGD